MSEKNDVKALLKSLEELDSQAEALKEQRDALNAEAKKWAERRDALNLKSSEVWNELKAHRERRDEENRTVKTLKERRAEITAQANMKREEYVALRERADKILGRTSQSAGSVKHQIDKLDWEIQTNPLSPAEENEIIEQIRLLEKELLIHKEAKGLKEKLTELKAELGVLRLQSSEVHGQITELANKSQEHHEKMFEKMSEVKPLKDEADAAHRRHLECREAAGEAHRKYLETVEEIKITNLRIKEIEGAEQKKRIEKETETAIETASKKLRDKKRLTLEEFKLLKEKGLL